MQTKSRRMHLISIKKLREFWELHPDASGPLHSWSKVIEHAQWENFAEVRSLYASADQVGRFTVFNIGGNEYRLIAVIHFNRSKVYVRHILTHKEYDNGSWKNG